MTTLVLAASAASAAGSAKRFAKLDGELNRRTSSAPSRDTTSVIVRFRGEPPEEFRKYARPGALPLVNGYVLDLPNAQLKALASHSDTVFASHNAAVHAFNFRTSVQSGAFFARRMLGFDGAGVGVAVLDSGVAPVDDLTGAGRGGRSVRFFHDFLVPDSAHAGRETACTAPCDYNGHGTHIAATIAGDGFDSRGERAGLAPGASIYALRVLGVDGSGSVDGVIRALGWVYENARANNIRIVNLSFGMAPSGSLPDVGNVAKLLSEDPLAVATKALVDKGIFVVAAAGNHGQVACASLPNHLSTETGRCEAWGGVTAPGTYPWVFTVGANTSNGTMTRRDDARAAFSSRGPAFPLQNAKPDLLAGGVGIESASAPGSALYADALVNHPQFLLRGSFPTASFPYMSLSGTSQAAAALSGVAALMLQANPRLTPNLMKAVLEYTSQDYAGNSPLEQGAGFLNALGAIRLARFYATARSGQQVPVEPIWSKHFIWGNHEMSGGLMIPGSNAWTLGVIWGVPKVNGDTGDNIVWGTSCGLADCGDNIVWGTGAGDNIVWGTADGDNIVWGTSQDGDNIVWGTSIDGDNIVWGTDCGGQDCGDNIVWGTAGDGDNIVWGTAEPGDNIVWGTSADGDNIVWGTFGDGDNIVWGTAADGDNIVWGTAFGGDNVVWGTVAQEGDNIVWGTFDLGDNIVWGTDGDNIVWGTDGDNIVWGTGHGSRPATQDEWFRLFLNRRFDVWWVSQEFGDRFLSRHK